MRSSRRLPRILLFVALIVAILVVPQAAGAQQIPTPGVTPEEVRGWTWYLLSLPVALGTVALVALLGLSYLRLSSRFFGKEEPPPTPPRRRRPQFAGVAAAPRVEQVAAASTTPPAPPAAAVRTAAEQEPKAVAVQEAAEPEARTEAPPRE